MEPAKWAYRLRLARYASLAETIAAFVRAEANGNGKIELLDVGAGDGRSFRYLEALGVADKVDFHGLELCEKRIAKMYAKDRWALVLQGDVEQGIPTPPLPDQFDVVICEQVLEHLRNPSYALGEMARVLKPGGMLVLGVPIFPPGVAAIRRHLVPMFDRRFGIERGHVQAFSLRSFCRLVQETGHFDIVARRGFRILSGGVLAPLENCRWWWEFNGWLGRMFPAYCIEAQIVAKRRIAG